MKSSEIISSILIRYKERSTKYPQSASFVSNDNGTSFYLSQKREEGERPVQIRISNHGTYLKTWVDRQHLADSASRLFDPAICINISIVFVDEGNDLTFDCTDQQDCNNCMIEPCIPQTFEGQNELGRQFEVYQYVYKSKCIASRYINGLTKAIMEAAIKGKYVDPLRNLYRTSFYKKLTSDKTKQNNNEIKESKTYKNMNTKKQVIRLTESDLKRMIKEAIEENLLTTPDGSVIDISRPDPNDGTYTWIDSSPNPFTDHKEEKSKIEEPKDIQFNNVIKSLFDCAHKLNTVYQHYDEQTMGDIMKLQDILYKQVIFPLQRINYIKNHMDN